MDKEKESQPEVNIGLIGHVDHGKTTLTERLSGKWTDTHSEEIKRGITIRLGYADTSVYKCSKDHYTTKRTCEICKSKTVFERKVSFIDAPGHETLMATMLSGAAIMDGALLLIAANEECPQPQTREHLMALDIIGIKNIIIVQSKIDLTAEDQALENYKQIKEFTKGTIAEKAPIIPISALHDININELLKEIQDVIKTPKRDSSKSPLFFVARSFDINRPGTDITQLMGGVLGGSLKQGKLKLNDEIEIRPGLKIEKENKSTWKPIMTRIVGLKTGEYEVKELAPGGSSGVLTSLDPSIVKSDNLTGNVMGLKNQVPEVFYEFNLKPKLLERVVGAKDNLVVEPIKKGEILMLNVNSAATVGTVTEMRKEIIHVSLKIPVCLSQPDRITISRNVGARWRLIGFASLENEKIKN
ncbi:translation initiation factor IF-2 subunit gamma [Candidatus Woesearchaeota archaeon]|nr:translation initiation factor IF-2 subunit gamma [Candidatus Woesearchaeota archaeon]